MLRLSSGKFVILVGPDWGTRLARVAGQESKLANGDAVYPIAERLHAKGVPFAFLTAWDGEIDARYCNVPMLGKPFSLAELESCLQALVGGRIKPADREAA